MTFKRVVVAALLVGVGELALYALWPLVDDSDPPPAVDQQLALAAVLFLLALPHVLARLAYRDRPWLFQIAGGLGIVLTLVSVLGFSIIFVTIPLVLIPSILYLARHPSSAHPAIGTGPLFGIVVVLCLGAVGAFFLTQDPRCSITMRRDGRLVRTEPPVCNAASSGTETVGAEVVERSASSDSVALHESLLSLALSGTALALCVHARARGSDELNPPHGTTG